MTKQELIDDIKLQCTQSSPSDDSEISDEQVAFWLSYHANQIMTQEITTELKNGRFIPPIYIAEETCKALTIEAAQCGDDCQDRVYIDLTGEVLDLPKDAGIVRLLTQEGDQILKASLESLDYLKNLRFAKPSRSNPLYFRQAKRIYIEGIQDAEVDLEEVSVAYVKKQDIQALADTDEVILSTTIAPMVIDSTLQRLKLQMYGSEADRASDGVDYKNAAYHNVISNPAKTEDTNQ